MGSRKIIISPLLRNKLKKSNVLLPKRSYFSKFNLPSTVVRIEPFSRFCCGRNLCNIGSFSYSNSSLDLNANVGRYTSIASNVRLMSIGHPLDRFTTSNISYTHPRYLKKNASYRTSPFEEPEGITIGNDVWIGNDVLFKKGLTVGDGAVVAANSVVTKDVPPYAVVGGVPAKILKYRFPEEIRNKLLEIKWWDYDFRDFIGVNDLEVDLDISQFVPVLEDLIKGNEIRPYTPEPVFI